MCGYCKNETAPDDYGALNSPEEDPELESNFGRRKREADGGDKEICIRFSVRYNLQQFNHYLKLLCVVRNYSIKTKSTRLYYFQN